MSHSKDEFGFVSTVPTNQTPTLNPLRQPFQQLKHQLQRQPFQQLKLQNFPFQKKASGAAAGTAGAAAAGAAAGTAAASQAGMAAAVAGSAQAGKFPF